MLKLDSALTLAQKIAIILIALSALVLLTWAMPTHAVFILANVVGVALFILLPILILKDKF